MMKLDIKAWIAEYLQVVEALFEKRLLFVGLQGSYARGEAHKDSDLDVVVIADYITAADLQAYDRAIASLSHRDKICGFICGKREIVNWERADLFQFYYDTIWLRGNLDALVSPPGRQEAAKAVLNGACGIYHMCAHNLVHEKDMRILASLYKTAIFVLKALHYERTGNYVGKKAALALCLNCREQDIIMTQQCLESYAAGRENDFYLWSERLLRWSGDLIEQYGGDCGTASVDGALY